MYKIKKEKKNPQIQGHNRGSPCWYLIAVPRRNDITKYTQVFEGYIYIYISNKRKRKLIRKYESYQSMMLLQSIIVEELSFLLDSTTFLVKIDQVWKA